MSDGACSRFGLPTKKFNQEPRSKGKNEERDISQIGEQHTTQQSSKKETKHYCYSSFKMNWIERCRFFAKVEKSALSNFEVPLLNSRQHGIPSIERARGLHCLQQSQRRWLSAILSGTDGLWTGDVKPERRLILARNVLSRYLSRGFAIGVENDPQLSRNFLAQLWFADRKLEKSRKKRRPKIGYSNVAHNQHPSFQPPPSQSLSGFLEPASPEEALVAPLLARSNLMITRDIEWANLVLGFEQENRYMVMDVCYPTSPVGFIRERSNLVARQLLRLRRPFVAYITDAMENVLFRVRRPFWWITSSIYAEIDGKEVGVVHRRWHLWRRIYDLYLGNKQFAVVENPGLWNWTFTLKDINGEVLAQIDRDWRGFGFEIFTDAGQYVIRFGSSDPSSKSGLATAIPELEVARPLTLSERAVVVALAISLDNDYFSRHGGCYFSCPCKMCDFDMDVDCSRLSSIKPQGDEEQINTTVMGIECSVMRRNLDEPDKGLIQHVSHQHPLMLFEKMEDYFEACICGKLRLDSICHCTKKFGFYFKSCVDTSPQKGNPFHCC